MLLATLLSLGLAASHVAYPEEAALVIGGRLVILHVAARSLEAIALPGLVPEEADISQPDARKIVVNAKPKGGRHFRLYLVDVPSGKVTPLPDPFAGDERFPRFSDGGKSLLFTATALDTKGGPQNRGHLFELRLSDGRIRRLPGSPDLCEFEPVALAGGHVAHISTTCFLRFNVEDMAVGSGKSRSVAEVGDAAAELAASPDGKRYVYTAMDVTGLGFYLIAGSKAPRRIAVVRRMGRRVQPRFICPRDLVFVNGPRIWALDTKTGELTNLMSAGLDAARGGKEGKVEP